MSSEDRIAYYIANCQTCVVCVYAVGNPNQSLRSSAPTIISMTAAQLGIGFHWVTHYIATPI